MFSTRLLGSGGGKLVSLVRQTCDGQNRETKGQTERVCARRLRRAMREPCAARTIGCCLLLGPAPTPPQSVCSQHGESHQATQLSTRAAITIAQR